MSLKKMWLDLTLKWKLLFLGCVGVVIMGISALLLSDSTNREISSQVEKSMLREAELQGKLIAEGSTTWLRPRISFCVSS
jgi:hypothetical protein